MQDFPGPMQTIPPGFARGITFPGPDLEPKREAMTKVALGDKPAKDRGGTFNFSAMFDAVLDEEEADEENGKENEKPKSLFDMIDEQQELDKQNGMLAYALDRVAA